MPPPAPPPRRDEGEIIGHDRWQCALTACRRAEREFPQNGVIHGRSEGRVRRPCSEFEHAVAHGRHHVARDDRLWLLAPFH